MKIISINIRGFGKDDNSESKVGWFRRLRLSERPEVVLIQESKCNRVDDKWIEFIWGSSNVRYLQKEKVGQSGGMLLLWDPNIVDVIDAVEGQFFLAIRGKWQGKINDTIVVNVYGPHKDDENKKFWDSLQGLMSFDNDEWVIGGDFIEVRSQDERQNSIFIERRAKLFNNFIEQSHLIEVPLLGKKFTKISDDGKKFSKLDRFLVSKAFINTWGDVSTITLDQKSLDHYPLMLRDSNQNFGPKPFKIFNIRLEIKEVEQIIIEAWNLNVFGSRPDCIFRNKLKNVKEALRKLSKFKYGPLDIELDKWKRATDEFESKAEAGMISDLERIEWLQARAMRLKKEKEKASMLRQKARLRWAAEGDDNTSFFHSMIPRNNNKLSIRGLHINGTWVESPDAIKD
ncbi:uncharacterized protein [Rutidosis leptorrhynchoides]|uniref:uncharacterized protein n=1 Tax=Rutidosis leptorrhynchoides TaxID=125765 RepID=UPI003A9A4A27